AGIEARGYGGVRREYDTVMSSLVSRPASQPQEAAATNAPVIARSFDVFGISPSREIAPVSHEYRLRLMERSCRTGVRRLSILEAAMTCRAITPPLLPAFTAGPPRPARAPARPGH